MKTLIKILVAGSLILGLWACKTIEVVREIEKPIEVPIIKEKIDTFILQTYDSVLIHSRNDTVFSEKTKIIYKDKIKIEKDTIHIPITIEKKIVETKVEEKKIRSFFHYFGISSLIFIALFLLYQIKKLFL